ncbi:HNH endonuclease signature motif containing protein [Micromonospora sp. WMMD882]|uniref:HNH endonuclease n=1 Tax=Micromonospora sp. WMMD882 TaxID=3015151 RepID=UPI00248CB1A3|nr:HNH endonuclease signature motif containing protein [Micromonospora sp. WMMD882]WBB77707.1 HNH endonuclease signature motif containing protein [Micromonospora sp. WMMD882]
MGISVRTRKLLWGRAHNRCAFPQCRQELTTDQIDAHTGETFTTVVGEEAHIRSSRSDGPRHEPDFANVDEYENLILLCPVHHTMVDADGGRGYDVETLVKMRRAHERHEQRSEHIERTVRAYVGDQYAADDRVLFEQAELRGPSVDAMFVDVPFGCRLDAAPAELMARIAASHPGDATPIEGYIVTGAAQALLHPEWTGNALLVGGPGAGKSTLLQYIQGPGKVVTLSDLRLLK